MLSLNLTAAEYHLYLQTLAGSYDMKTVVHVLDLEHRVISDISHLLIDGDLVAEEVEADPNAGDDDYGTAPVAIQQTCSLTLEDPARTVGLDSRSPADAAIYLDRMVKVVVSVFVPELGWVDCPQFCGPIIKFDRDGVVAAVEAQSKEVLLLDQSNAQGPSKYSGVKTDVMRQIAIDFGEDPARINIPAVTNNPRVPEAVVFRRLTLPWNRLWYLGRTLSMTPFYDARGILRPAPDSTVPVMTLGPEWVTSTLQVGYDTTDLRNGVWVRGSKSSISQSQYLVATNPNSRQRLGRRGKLRTRLEAISDSDIRSDTEARRVAKRELKRRGATIVRPAFTTHPIWPLEIGDMLALNLAQHVGTMRSMAFRRPLTHAGEMSHGYIEPVLTPSADIRRA